MLGLHEKDKVLDAIASTRQSLEEARLKEETASKRVAEAPDKLERFQRSLELTVARSIREGYEKALKGLSSHLAPISTLPNELLSCIFSTGLGMEQRALQSKLGPVMALRVEELGGLGPFALNFAETCSHVNSHWRRVALATPVLWRDLKFSRKAAKNERERLWLERSKQTHLTIHLPSMHKHLFSNLLETLRPHLHRARVFSNEGQGLELIFNLIHNLPLKMDHLRTLELRADDAPPVEGTVHNLFEEGAPNLQEVILGCIPLSLVAFPTNNITKLCLVQSEICILRLDTLLQSVASTLKWLYIELNNLDPLQSNLTTPPQHSSSPTQFPNLHTLELGEDGILTSTHILTNYWFPVLKILYLDIQDSQIDIFAGLLNSTAPATLDVTERINVQRVPCFNVRELVLSNMADLQTTGFRALLMKAFPSLERLHLADEFEDDQLVAIFSGANKGCKRLSSLRLASCRGSLLKRFVDRRLDKHNGATPLRRLELGSKEGITRNEWQYLMGKVDEVSLTDPETNEEGYTDEDEDSDTNGSQQALDADTDGEDDWTTDEGTP